MPSARKLASMRRAALPLSLALLLLGCSDDGGPTPADASAERLVGDIDSPGEAGGEGPGPDAPTPASCSVGARPGAAGNTDGEKTPDGLGYNVRTPPGYDATKGYPLIVVYAGAGGSAATMEPYTALTNPALAAGYIIAYADHQPPNNFKGVADLATIPAQIAETWCVDRARIYLTGHSDGGSVIYVGLFRGDFAAAPPAAIAPSAAGINAAVLASAQCPTPPIPAMVLHSENDALFPGFGREARDFWLACYQCDASPSPGQQGCVNYSGCNSGSDLRFCETSGGHGAWPAKNDAMLAFFGAHRR